MGGSHSLSQLSSGFPPATVVTNQNSLVFDECEDGLKTDRLVKIQKAPIDGYRLRMVQETADAVEMPRGE